MKVLVLSPCARLLMPVFAAAKDDIRFTDVKISDLPMDGYEPDFIVSFNHRHIIKEPYLNKYKDRMVNIHTSLLPWNRGANPNFWSWFDDTPKGVSIHRIDAGIDTGAVLAKQEVTWLDKDELTLKSSWEELQEQAALLFQWNWPKIRIQKANEWHPRRAGSYHSHSQFTELFEHMPLGWDTPVKDVEAMGRACRKKDC